MFGNAGIPVEERGQPARVVGWQEGTGREGEENQKEEKEKNPGERKSESEEINVERRSQCEPRGVNKY